MQPCGPDPTNNIGGIDTLLHQVLTTSQRIALSHDPQGMADEAGHHLFACLSAPQCVLPVWLRNSPKTCAASHLSYRSGQVRRQGTVAKRACAAASARLMYDTRTSAAFLPGRGNVDPLNTATLFHRTTTEPRGIPNRIALWMPCPTRFNGGPACQLELHCNNATRP